MYLSKVDFVEDDLVGVADTPESGQEGECGDEREGDLVVSLGGSRARGIGSSLRELVELDFYASNLLLFAGAANIPLAETPLRGGRRGHDGKSRCSTRVARQLSVSGVISVDVGEAMLLYVIASWDPPLHYQACASGPTLASSRGA